MRNLLTILCGAWLLLAIASCAKSTTDAGLGTNTNWLRACEETSECEGDDVCVCGQCTQPCTASSQCGSVHEEASCEPVEEAACGESVGIASACLQGCESNGDCTALKDGRCVSDLCVPAPAVPNNDGGPREDAGRDGSVGNDDPFALTYSVGTIQITAAYTECSRQSDCALVDTSCDGCCGQGAIRGSLSETYTEHMTAACAGYEGLICDCAHEDLVPRCIEGMCHAVRRDDTECFGPEANPEQGDAPDAVGCSCPRLDLLACAGASVTLACVAEHRGLGWSLSDNEVCLETPAPCATPTTIEACAADYDVCFLQPSGGYCGMSFVDG